MKHPYSSYGGIDGLFVIVWVSWQFNLCKLLNAKSIFIVKGFRTIVFIFIVISTTFRPICPPAYFRCLSNSGTYTELRTTSFIESTGVARSDSVNHNRVQVLRIPLLLRFMFNRTHSVTVIGVGSLSF